MNNHSKRLVKHLEAIGFRRDYDAVTPARAYRHPNDPDTLLKVFDKMTDSTITTVQKVADKIAGAGSSGTSSTTIKERARISRQSNKARRDAEIKAANERGAKAEAEHQRREVLVALARRESETNRLMQPGHGV